METWVDKWAEWYRKKYRGTDWRAQDYDGLVAAFATEFNAHLRDVETTVGENLLRDRVKYWTWFHRYFETVRIKVQYNIK